MFRVPRTERLELHPKVMYPPALRRPMGAQIHNMSCMQRKVPYDRHGYELDDDALNNGEGEGEGSKGR